MLPRQEKAKGVHHHQTSITRNVKGSSLRRKGRKNMVRNMNNKITITTYLSTITLNANGLNAPIKRHRWLNRL